MKKYIFLVLTIISLSNSLTVKAADPLMPDSNPPPAIPGMELKWNDEFNINGKPSASNWKYENGFVRNEELQWYQSANVNCVNGVLLLEGKREQVLNPNYVAGSTDWKKNRQYATFTSGSIISQGLQQFQYGRFEIRARIDTTKGSWPAIWTKGVSGKWPNCGETDIMEFYRSSGVQTILANVAWGSATAPTVGTWDTKKTALSYFLGKDAAWCTKFHVWRMDWTPDVINLYLDDELLNTTALSSTLNPPLNPPTITVANPHQQKHFFLLNLAIGANGGTPLSTVNYYKYEVDYIRVYQNTSTSVQQINEEKMAFYPNPCQGSLNINNHQEYSSATIINAMGQIIWKSNTVNSQIDLSAFPNGIYQVRLQKQNGKTFVSSVIKN